MESVTNNKDLLHILTFLKERHPMKPHRLSLTNALVIGYGLDKQIHYFYDPRPATKDELEAYHDSDYIGFLSRWEGQNAIEHWLTRISGWPRGHRTK